MNKSTKIENSEFFREKSKNKQIHQKLKTLNFSGKNLKINKFTKNKTEEEELNSEHSEFFREKSKNKQIRQKLKKKNWTLGIFPDSGENPKINSSLKRQKSLEVEGLSIGLISCLDIRTQVRHGNAQGWSRTWIEQEEIE